MVSWNARALPVADIDVPVVVAVVVLVVVLVAVPVVPVGDYGYNDDARSC